MASRALSQENGRFEQLKHRLGRGASTAAVYAMLSTRFRSKLSSNALLALQATPHICDTSEQADEINDYELRRTEKPVLSMQARRSRPIWPVVPIKGKLSWLDNLALSSRDLFLIFQEGAKVRFRFNVSISTGLFEAARGMISKSSCSH